MILCLWCASDEYVDDYDPSTDVASCSGPGHPETRMFQPRAEEAARAAQHSHLDGLPHGIAYELGLYEDLPAVLNHGEWADTIVVKYRYAIAHPTSYSEMVTRWDNDNTRYSTSAFIGSTLGDLSRATNVTHRNGPGTGFFSFNNNIGHWTLEPVPQHTITMNWQEFATREGLDPDQWPLAE